MQVSASGDWSETEKFLKRLGKPNYQSILNDYGRRGVAALRASTPKDSGETAMSWNYTVRTTAKGWEIAWTNDNKNDGALIAILIQHGHGTRNGGYVQGRDFINPAIRPVFDGLARDVWRKVSQ